MEKKRGEQKIGTTGRGIGPTYADKAQRYGIRVIDLLDEKKLRERLEIPLTEKNNVLEKYTTRNLLRRKILFRNILNMESY